MQTKIGPCGECWNCVCIKYHMDTMSSCHQTTMTIKHFRNGKELSSAEFNKLYQAVKSNPTEQACAKWDEVSFRNVCDECNEICSYTNKHGGD